MCTAEPHRCPASLPPLRARARQPCARGPHPRRGDRPTLRSFVPRRHPDVEPRDRPRRRARGERPLAPGQRALRPRRARRQPADEVATQAARPRPRTAACPASTSSPASSAAAARSTVLSPRPLVDRRKDRARLVFRSLVAWGQCVFDRSAGARGDLRERRTTVLFLAAPSIGRSRPRFGSLRCDLVDAEQRLRFVEEPHVKHTLPAPKERSKDTSAQKQSSEPRGEPAAARTAAVSRLASPQMPLDVEPSARKLGTSGNP